MAGAAVTGLLLVLALMPETKGRAQAVKKIDAKRLATRTNSALASE
jgi:hypothetical protein